CMTLGTSFGIIIARPLLKVLAMVNNLPCVVITDGAALKPRPVRPSDPSLEPTAAPAPPGASTHAGRPHGKTDERAHTGALPHLIAQLSEAAGIPGHETYGPEPPGRRQVWTRHAAWRPVRGG